MITDEKAIFLMQGSTKDEIVYWVKWLVEHGFTENDFIRCFDYNIEGRDDGHLSITWLPNEKPCYICIGEDSYLWFGACKLALYKPRADWERMFKENYTEIKL